MSKKNIILVVANIILAVLLFIWWTSLQIPAPDSAFSQHKITFNLQHDQQVVSEKLLDNKVGLIFLGDMHCSDACPQILMRMRLSLESLNDTERGKVKVLFINLEPTDEASAEVAKLARFFHPDILGLSGKKDALQAVIKSLFFEQSISELRTHHPRAIVIVRPDGYVAAQMKQKADLSAILSAVRVWLPWAA